MPRPPKHHEISKLLKQRLDAGVYLDQPIPSERVIAGEVGVSCMTVRKAVQHLVDQKILTRQKNGRLKAVASVISKRVQRKYVLVTPAFESYACTNVRIAIQRVMSQYRGILKEVNYRHWHDASLMSVFDGDWDGIFLITPKEGTPKLLLDRMLANRDRLISVYSDLTELGIVSVDNSRPQWAGVLVEHLISLGHDRVDCLRAQPGVGKCSRVAGWEDALTQNNITGKFWNAPVKNFQLNWVHAYELALDALASKQMAPAIFCTTVTVAKGLGRAAYELNLKPGKDLFYCTMDAPLEAIYEVPSITTLNLQPLQHGIQKAFAWLAGEEQFSKTDCLRIMPQEPPEILHGESTGCATRARQIQVNEDYRDE
jgi:DNA-binding LacI/PurR family transcriptional regulator